VLEPSPFNFPLFLSWFPTFRGVVWFVLFSFFSLPAAPYFGVFLFFFTPSERLELCNRELGFFGHRLFLFLPLPPVPKGRPCRVQVSSQSFDRSIACFLFFLTGPFFCAFPLVLSPLIMGFPRPGVFSWQSGLFSPSLAIDLLFLCCVGTIPQGTSPSFFECFQPGFFSSFFFAPI